MNASEKSRYSITNLIKNLAANAEGIRAGASYARDNTPACFEDEVSKQIAKEINTVPQFGGRFVPLAINASGLVTSTDAAGGFTISDRPGDLIDLLVEQALVLQLGGQFLTNLRVTSLPKEVNEVQGEWVPEAPGADVPQSDASFASIALRPHMFSGFCAFSRNLMERSSLQMETFVKSRLARSHAQAIDRASLIGSGVGNEPVGLLFNSGVNLVEIASPNGGGPSAAKMIEMEKAVSDSNVSEGNLAWITNPTMRSRLRKVAEFPSSLVPIWRDNSMLDHPARVTNFVPKTLVKGTSSDCSAIFLGSWSQLVIAEFQGAIELVVDPFSLKKRGMLEVASYGLYDIAVLHADSFARAEDARDV